ncbi:hypothetical protein B2G71_16850 [Novosphingobium sp. PC22D]|uniref:TPM domain-containing protein n=1 Tax=Novosphingobium sp. PC22D TaxID=1962403 RepID=UPI000BF11D5F|nr:TPM domain-containing protein [Novosphingobium sp. PC22D]PEQ11497.1 hypothetical protein B2G71_16850 [Novosphingobium sp. PC22D]
MKAPRYLSEQDHARVSAAVGLAEAHTAGEIVTIIAERSDGYTDVALAWAAFAAILALGVLAIAPEAALDLYENLTGGWIVEWTSREIFFLAALAATFAFGCVLLVQLWQPLKFGLVPSPIKSARVRDRALRAFRIGAERRTHGRTGILIYLSMRERRAEIVADEAIATRIDPEVWGDAMTAMLDQIRAGRVADGMIAAIEGVGAVLADHFPPARDDRNELPDRLIEV